MNIFAIGALINSALYLFACWYAAVVFGYGVTWRLAVASMGVTYVSHVLNLAADSDPRGRTPWHPIPEIATWLSIVLGAAAGITLLIGI